MEVEPLLGLVALKNVGGMPPNVTLLIVPFSQYSVYKAHLQRLLLIVSHGATYPPGDSFR